MPGMSELEYEEHHVHQVYEQIADHFSSTRYKPWPIVERFLKGLDAGSIGLDVGCGNGKYLTVNPDVFIVASDRSLALASIAKTHQPHTTVVADTLDLPHPNEKFDFAICIAVIHHLSTPERRIQAVRSILQTLRQPVAGAPGAKALLYVWALEQKTSRRGWDQGDAQDVMVPWVLRSKNKSKDNASDSDKTFERYYHLYHQGELESDIVKAGGEVVDCGYEKDNWWAIATVKGSKQ